jgi:hypothetical protein
MDEKHGWRSNAEINQTADYCGTRHRSERVPGDIWENCRVVIAGTARSKLTTASVHKATIVLGNKERLEEASVRPQLKQAIEKSAGCRMETPGVYFGQERWDPGSTGNTGRPPCFPPPLYPRGGF